MDRYEVLEILRQLAKDNDKWFVEPDSDVLDLLVQFAEMVEKCHRRNDGTTTSAFGG